VDASGQVSRLWIDRPEPHQAAESRLDMAARAAEPVVEIEMPKSSVEVVARHQDHHPAAKPDAFRVAGRTVDSLRGLDEFVSLALVVLGGIGRGFTGLVLDVRVAALGKRAAEPDQEGKPGNGEVAQNRSLKLKHTSTHKFPDLLPSRGQF
jgi:hypothetical protein